MLPSRSWRQDRDAIRAVGEHRGSGDDGSIAFLQSLGLIAVNGLRLTTAGQAYFEAEFIEQNSERSREILGGILLQHCAEAAALAQALAKHERASREIAESVIRNQGYGERLTNRRLGTLLALMHEAQVIDYSKSEGQFKVLAQPLSEKAIPDSVFISPDTPWSNGRWLSRILAEAQDFVYWFDKHWLPGGLDLIGESIDGDRVGDLRVLSLEMDESVTKRAKRKYRDLGRELGARGISFEWRFAESQSVRRVHDRWIVTGSSAWNVPNLNAITSGQRSELMKTDNGAKLTSMFDGLWHDAAERPLSNEGNQ
jgi:hypothetical protein